MTNVTQTVLTVSELNRQVKWLLEQQYPLIWLEGEISNLSAPHSGHWYFTLKDSHAQIRCAMFRTANQGVGFKPSLGTQVLVRAKVSLYPGRGDYQLIVEQLEESGAGALQRAFEVLKNKLDKLGWFKDHIKQPLPKLPKQIGVITSPTGAAVRDVLTTLQRRFPAIPVLIYPTEVQGAKAGTHIAGAITCANQRRECDVLLLVRGGGSLEDLWAFNEEIVAEAIYSSALPIVTGIGHEVDFTIADLVADYRAPTPTAAAEAVTPDKADWLHKLQTITTQLLRQFNWLLQNQTQTLDYLQLTLQSRIKHQLQLAKHHLLLAQNQLNQNHPSNQIQQTRTNITLKHQTLIHQIQTRLTGAKAKLRTLTQTLEAVSPLQTLNRGYSITQDIQGKVIKKSSDIQSGEKLKITLYQGEIFARAQ